MLSRPGTRWPAASVLGDLGLAGITLAAVLVQLSHGGVLPTTSTDDTLDATSVVLAACAALPIAAQRLSPVAVFAVTALSTIALAGLGYPVDLGIGPMVALYLLAASRDQTAPWNRHLTALVVGAFVAYLASVALAQSTVPGVALLHTGLAGAVAWFAGDRTSMRRHQLNQLRERAVRAEQDAMRDRQLAVAEERARIARDLHDSAAQAISVIAVRAGTARLRFGTNPDRTLAALEDVEALARRTVAEMDQIIGTLREVPAPDDVEAPTSLASVNTLVARHATAGLRVTVDVSGQPRPLPTATDQAAFRILQESLTNAARHGTGGVRVTLVYQDASVELTVTNPVRTDAATASRAGGGHGIIGMHERATLLGGTLEAHRHDGHFRVHAEIPAGGHRP